jgi:hypothetical protein
MLEQLVQEVSEWWKLSKRQRVFPTNFYVGNRKLGDFKVPKNVYNFGVPTSTPNLSNLRKPLSVNWDLAGKLFIPNFPGSNGKVGRW